MNLSFILIGSLPTKGMKSIGNVSLLAANKKHTIIEKHIINITSVFPTAEIIVVGGFENKKMQKLIDKHKRVKFTHHEIYSNSNETQSLKQGLSLCTNTKCIVFNTNCIVSKSFWSKLKYRIKKSIIIINPNKRFNSNLGATINNDKVNYIFFGLPNKITNIYILQSDHIKYFLEQWQDSWKSKYLFETINTLSKYKPFYYQEINNSISLINNMKDYHQISKKKESYV